jgi:hypothetical protein
MKIDYTLPRRPVRDSKTEMTAPAQIICPRPPRVTCLLALAHRFEQLVRSGQVRDYADLARLGRVSRARISQILNLLTLAPSIQELILGLPPRTPGEKTITERHLRKVLYEPRWDRQCILLNSIWRGFGNNSNESKHRAAQEEH